MVKLKNAKGPVKKLSKEGSKESKLIALMLGKKAYTPKELAQKTGYADASVKMYLSQVYLDRKGKPFKIVEEKGGKFRYEAR